MDKTYKITDKDYDNLFGGKVKYILCQCQKVGYGFRCYDSETAKWYENLVQIIARCFNRMYCNRYVNYLQYYGIAVYGRNKSEAFTWTDEDLKMFIKGKSLSSGDILNVYYIMPRGNGKGHICLRGYKYVILKDGWEEHLTLMGA